MKISELDQNLKEKITKALSENNPAPVKPNREKEIAEPEVKPGKEEKRRKLGNPNVNPKPKATMNEADMLSKIMKRFKSKKKMNEDEQLSPFEKGYKRGYTEGYEDASKNKKNKFNP